MSKLDRDALMAVLEFIEANPDKWRQESWESECRTKFCFAGWACVMAGDVPTKKEVDDSDENTGRSPWSKNAVEILGLTDYDARVLFSGSNDLGQLRRYVNYIIARHADV